MNDLCSTSRREAKLHVFLKTFLQQKVVLRNKIGSHKIEHILDLPENVFRQAYLPTSTTALKEQIKNSGWL